MPLQLFTLFFFMSNHVTNLFYSLRSLAGENDKMPKIEQVVNDES